MRALLAAALLLLAITHPACPASADEIDRAELGVERVRAGVDRLRAGPDAAVGPARVLDAAELAAFYSARDYRPAWVGFDRDVAFGPRALVRLLDSAGAEGLDPDLFHRGAVALLLDRVDWTADDALALELLLSDGLLALARTYALGTAGLNEAVLDPNLPLGRPDPAAAVAAIAAGRAPPGQALEALLPALDDYRRLREALPDAPPEARRAVVVTLGRMRALPRGEALHVLVNVPEFRLELRDGQRLLRSMKVIVGMKSRRTPVLSDRIERVVFNPSWSVPASIARKDILPKVRGDPDYLPSRGFRVLRGHGAQAEVVDPASVDWSSLSRMGELRFEQRPGLRNALGRLKFLFPNPIRVYLHDTPDRHLFEREVRALSSGCVRVEEPVALATALLVWDEEVVLAAIAAGRNRSVELDTPVPVHLVYWTARIGPDGELVVFEDLYKLDEAAEKLLRREVPDS